MHPVLHTPDKVDNITHIWALSGLDQLSLQYRNYLVRGCRYEVMFYPASDSGLANAASNFTVGTICGPEAFQTEITGTLTEWMEYPRTKKYSRQATFQRTFNPMSSGLGRLP